MCMHAKGGEDERKFLQSSPPSPASLSTSLSHACLCACMHKWEAFFFLSYLQLIFPLCSSCMSTSTLPSLFTLHLHHLSYLFLYPSPSCMFTCVRVRWKIYLPSIFFFCNHSSPLFSIFLSLSLSHAHACVRHWWKRFFCSSPMSHSPFFLCSCTRVSVHL